MLENALEASSLGTKSGAAEVIGHTLVKLPVKVIVETA
jgi:hypothetical protein